MLFSFVKHVLSFFLQSNSRSRAKVQRALNLATQKVRNLLRVSGSSFPNICLLIESADDEDELKMELDRLNKIMKIFFLAAPLIEHDSMIAQALKELSFSDKFGYHLNLAETTYEGIKGYKRDIAREFNVRNRKMQDLVRRDTSFDEELFSTYFRQPTAEDSTIHLANEGQPTSPSLGRKRVLSELAKGEKQKYSPHGISSDGQPTSKELFTQKKRQRGDDATYGEGHGDFLFARPAKKLCSSRDGGRRRHRRKYSRDH